MTQIQKKVSTFRQTGWLELGTGLVHEFYGSEQPAQDGTFKKLWDNLLTITTEVQPFVEPVNGAV